MYHNNLKETEMKLCVATWVCVTVILFGGSALGQQPPVAPAAPSEQLTEKKEPVPAPKHKLGPLEISINWRTRAEGWNWFEDKTGNSDYGLWDSLLRVGIGQTGEHFDWFIEGEQPSILGLPNDAVVAAPQGQLGLGGNYYAANNNHANVANGFVKQAFANLKHLGPLGLKVGRFEYFDGLEVKPKDPLLATVIQTRISSRLISNFAFAAVQRTYDGVQLSADSGQNNFTFFGARPTQGVFQVKGMNELDVDTYYGAYTRSVKTSQSAGELRVFALGYIDHRTTVLKTDNRSAALRAADLDKIEIATWGADYVHVYHTTDAGNFDFLVWGVVQTGSWGNLTQRAGAFVGEAGWQPPVRVLKTWLSAGYSYGSGDGNPNDTRHGTFFQVLTTPRQYARFPFYNMMNNED
jgi:Alginate export